MSVEFLDIATTQASTSCFSFSSQCLSTKQEEMPHPQTRQKGSAWCCNDRKFYWCALEQGYLDVDYKVVRNYCPHLKLDPRLLSQTRLDERRCAKLSPIHENGNPCYRTATPPSLSPTQLDDYLPPNFSSIWPFQSPLFITPHIQLLQMSTAPTWPVDPCVS